MGTNTKIAWTDHTFNPWIGCTKVGPGCDHCYAEAMNRRFKFDNWGPGKPRRHTSPANWRKPLQWDREAAKNGVRAKVFCASMADVFDKEVPDEWRDDLWALIRATPNLDWQLLTKRIGNAAKMLPADWGRGYPNVWLMATVVTDDEYVRDVPKLLAIPAVVHGLSVEPQLTRIHARSAPQVDWIITGAESGPGARPYDDVWPILWRGYCQMHGIAFFFKQEIVNGRKVELPELDGRVWAEFPRPRRQTW